MAPVAHRLIGYGVVTCLAGILFSMVATQLVGLLYEALPPQTIIAGAIIEFITTVVGVRATAGQGPGQPERRYQGGVLLGAVVHHRHPSCPISAHRR